MKNIAEIVDDKNIAEKLDDETLGKIAVSVSDGFDIDKESRSGWEKKNKEAIKLAQQIWEDKNFPFENAANVKYPLLATASIQFAARAYPNFVKEPDVVRGLVIGDDPDGSKAGRAERIGQHMSYQCLNEMEEWEEDTDKLLTILPILGCCFKKSWFNSVLKRNVSEFINPNDLILNYKAKSMATTPRISEVFTLYPNEIEERKRAGIFLNIDYGTPQSTKQENADQPVNKDPDQEHVFYEQHAWYDLDNDGYKEPYIFTFHKDTKQITRITARFDADGIESNDKGKILKVTPEQYYTKFPFMPSLDGSIYDFGFGGLLAPINRTINTTINQLLDSGTLYNANAGFIGKGIQLGRGRGGGKIEFELGEWKTVAFTGDDLRKNVLPLPVKEPSMVLFNLLGFMVNAGDRLSSVTEILTGEQSNPSEKPTTTLSRIEQGLKVFSSIHKRLYRSFRSEYKKLFRLNFKFLEPKSYFVVLDNPQSVAKEDYDYKTCDVVPVADPNELTNTQKLIKAQIYMEMLGKGFNDTEIKRKFLEAMQTRDLEKMLEAPPQLPDPKIVIEQQKLELEKFRFEFEVMKYRGEEKDRDAKIAKLLAQAEEHIAKAEAAEVGPNLEAYRMHLDSILKAFDLKHKMNVASQKTTEQTGGMIGGDNTAGMGQMEGGQGNTGMAETVPGTSTPV